MNPIFKASQLILKTVFGLLLLMLAAQGVKAQESPHEQLKQDCEFCHTPTAWNRIRFDHDRTNFPLEERHVEAQCKDCHDLGNFSEVSSQCFTCHVDIHEAKMGGDCQRCHSFRGWEIFDVEEIHTNTQFPLMGQHALVDCQSCHPNQLQGDFALTTTACISCHEQEYLATENPNHVANSFSTNCQECHEMHDWRPAFLANHDMFFPIFSGNHGGVWNDCSTCHPNPATLSDFTCLTCHEHRQSEMDSEHQGVPGYAYDSQACLSCHPTGEEGDFGDHDAQFFPIFTGTHAGEWQECMACHPNPDNRQDFTCVSCHEQEEMDGKHAGIQGYAYVSSECYLCHPTGEKGEFLQHDNLYFPIFSGRHAGEWQECLTCHPNPTNRQEFTCVTCHEHEQAQMDPEHSGIPGYVFESTACLSCHPDGEESIVENHDPIFPISSGAHNLECAECHVQPGNFQVFECILCHEHSQERMDDKHLGEVRDYVWESTACYDCHPDGRED